MLRLETGDRLIVLIDFLLLLPMPFDFRRSPDGQFLPAGDHRKVIHRLRTFEDSGEAVVVVLRKGIELVVVTAGTTECQAEKRLAQGVDLFVNDIHLHLDRVIFGEHFCTEGQKSGGDKTLGGKTDVGRCRSRIAVEQVSCQLFLNEPVVRDVGVQSADHIIPITKRVAIGEVFVEAVGIGVSGDVEPVTPPALAVVHRRQATVDQSFVGVGGIVVEKLGDLGGSRRQSDEIEKDAADEGPFVGRRCRLHPLLFQPGQDKMIDGVLYPRVVLNRRQPGFDRRLKRPVRFLIVGEGGCPIACVRIVRWYHYDFFARPEGTSFDPVGDGRDFLRGEFLLRRHLQFDVAVAQGADHQAFARFTRDDRRAACSPLNQIGEVFDAEFTFGIVGVMAVLTTVDQNRTDRLFKEVAIFG